jgi:AcrR family transcriptional regulator
MPRPKTLSDQDVLAAAHRLIQEHGPERLTFESLGRACGLSPATLVQRFGTKQGMKRRALLHAWDRLDERTVELAARAPKTPAGAIELLVSLSEGYGGIETYAQGLLVLREDLRDPALRARGAAWKAELSAALDGCFDCVPHAPKRIGLLMATQWQGSLLWWSFEPQGRVGEHVEGTLKRFVAALAGPPQSGGGGRLNNRRER